MNSLPFSSSVILIDSDYIDRVAFNLIVNFERMIGRRIPQCDLWHWLDCIALDGGLRPSENKIQALFLHSKEKISFDNFKPSNFEKDINGIVFNDNLGDFSLFDFPVENIVSQAEFFLQSLETLLSDNNVKHLMVVADMENYGHQVKDACLRAKETDITLFAMEPLMGRGFNQEILGYSLMSALGISSEEL